MHELAIAEDILEIVRQEADRNGIAKVIGVELEIGKLSGVDHEALLFALDIIEKGSLFENVNFAMKEISGRGLCKSCHEEFEMTDLLSACPECNLQPGTIICGKELRVISIMAE